MKGAEFRETLNASYARAAADAIKPDTEPGLEKWLSLNAEYAKVWPNITVKKAPPPDFKEWEGKPDKLQYFSPNPGDLRHRKRRKAHLRTENCIAALCPPGSDRRCAAIKRGGKREVSKLNPCSLWLSHVDGGSRGTIALAARHRLPAVYAFRQFVAAGGLVSYGIDQVDVWRRAALYVDRVLRGANPADLPVQAPTRYETAVNLKIAMALGLTVPPGVLVAADEVIE